MVWEEPLMTASKGNNKINNPQNSNYPTMNFDLLLEKSPIQHYYSF
jgi:hypothetical protein